MKLLFLLFFITKSALNVNAYIEMVVPDSKYALDLELYEDVLDAELCEEQMTYILSSNDTVLSFTFIDSNGRTPRGVLRGNTIDLGNYHQCLGINQAIPGSQVQGKYCLIELPFEQNITWPALPDWPDLPDLPDLPWPEFPWPDLDPRTTRYSGKILDSLKEYNIRKAGIDRLFGGNVDTRLGRYDNSLVGGLSMKLAICIPKTCSTQNALGAVTNLTELNLYYEDLFCRLPNDKPWRAGDIVAICVFGLFGLLALLSTAYDLHYNVFGQKDPKKVNKLLLSFSVYTNTRRLVTYNPVPGAIECLDGVRAIAMMWVIIGHTFVTQISSGIQYNPLDLLEYIMSARNIWVTSGPITVDTFFMLSGLLLVYTTNGKMKPMRLLKSLHLFYLNRILRILPVLCATILIQISFVNWFVDGPYWRANMQHIHRCRVNWWSTILHVQNYVNPSAMCLSHSWYLAIDMQLYIISPIILLWVLTGNKRIAWSALIGGLIAILAASGAYNFILAFPSGPIIPARLDEQERYVYYYYVNTLCRASPFFVGLIYGYVLSNYKGQTIHLSKIFVAFGHICAIVISALIMYSSYPIMQYDWDNQFADDMINTFMRPGWALAVGWMVFSCVHGYAGPINWILSLRAWKVLSRISYAMYLTHYPMIFAVNATPIAPVYFSGSSSVFKFFSDFMLAVIVSFFITVLVDSPCSTLIKQFMGGGVKRPPPAKTENEVQDKKADDNNLLPDKRQIDNNLVQGMSSTEHLVPEKVPLADGVQVSRF